MRGAGNEAGRGRGDTGGDHRGQEGLVLAGGSERPHGVFSESSPLDASIAASHWLRGRLAALAPRPTSWPSSVPQPENTPNLQVSGTDSRSSLGWAEGTWVGHPQRLNSKLENRLGKACLPNLSICHHQWVKV